MKAKEFLEGRWEAGEILPPLEDQDLWAGSINVVGSFTHTEAMLFYADTEEDVKEIQKRLIMQQAVRRVTQQRIEANKLEMKERVTPAEATRISVEAYSDFVRAYERKPNKEWYRFGQAFMNEIQPNVTDPEVFYGNRSMVESLIWARYVEATPAPSDDE